MNRIDGKTETLCIFGHPVAHSKSPAMHNALFEALGINARYLPFAPEPENFDNAVRGFRSMKFRGANVTIPYKTEFMESDGTPRLLDELSDISKFTGSVNTLYWKDGQVGSVISFLQDNRLDDWTEAFGAFVRFYFMEDYDKWVKF